MSSPDPSARGPGRSSADQAPEVVNVDQTFDVDGLYALRSTLAAHASQLGADTDQIEHLVIVASELATNAIRHGGGAGRLRLWHHDGVLYCQVSDNGPGIRDPAVGTTPPDPASHDGGRGLWICRHLSTELTIESGPDGHGASVTTAIAGASHRPPPLNR